MTKQEIKERLKSETFIDIMDKELYSMEGQECIVWKEKELGRDEPDRIVYVKDINLYPFVVDQPLDDESEIEVALESCYTQGDFYEIAHDLFWLAEILFDYVDWQSPNLYDYFDQGVDTVGEWVEYYGKEQVRDLFEVGIFDRNDFEADDLELLN